MFDNRRRQLCLLGLVVLLGFSLAFTSIAAAGTAIQPQVAAGDWSSYLLDSSGSVWCWGGTDNGELGIIDVADYYLPTRILTGTYNSITATNYGFFGLLDNGFLDSSGLNEEGLLGHGIDTSAGFPVGRVDATGAFSIISGGEGAAIGIKTDGSLWAWGTNNGQLGVGDIMPRSLPTPVVATGTFTACAMGMHEALAIKSDGSLWACGYNEGGILGVGSSDLSISTFRLVVATGSFTAVEAGRVLFAIKTDGSLWGWGAGGYGSIGDGTTNNVLYPKRIGTGSFSKVATGWLHTLAIKSDGSLWAWGSEVYALGTGSNESYAPTLVSPGPFSAIAAGSGHSLALKADGSVLVCGSDTFGRLGTGNQESYATLQRIANVNDMTAPTISYSGVSDGAVYYDHGVTPGFTMIGDNIRTTSYRLDGAPFVSGTGVSGEGEHVLNLYAEDIYDNLAARTVSFVIDNYPPTAPALGQLASPRRLTTAYISVTGDAGSTVCLYKNGAPAGSARVPGSGTVGFTACGLVAGTNSFSALAVDQWGLTSAFSAPMSFFVDVTKPSVTVTSPTAGKWLRGKFTATASAGDASSGLKSVVFFFRGKKVGTDTVAPYTCTIDSGWRSGGTYAKAVAVDRAGNSTTSQVYVVADNYLPWPKYNSYVQTWKVGGNFNFITYEFTHTTVLATVRVYLQGKLVRTLPSKTVNASVLGRAGAIYWNAKNSKGAYCPKGKYLVKLTLKDKAGNSFTANRYLTLR